MQFIHWLYANVLGNLVASGITVSIGYFKTKRNHERHHQAIMTKLTESEQD